ncbi:MAG TPA: methionyl-tRNA formyltransferase [Longimicrobium sp.]|jgi:methionyl-tRNA formyltransferase|uniref:methionyl-tRNA formyltransferase n=1 Tax=Longimicrobium sp. TaxID=2029185 RepID=UPI002EDBA514
MRTVLVGAVESTRVALEAMAAAGHAPEALLTLPPERSRRHSDYVDLVPTAERLGVRVIHAPDVNHPDAVAELRRMVPDHVLVIGWSQICRDDFLSVPRRGALGYHPSLLPRNRGRAVISWTVLQGVRETGSTLFWLDQGMDSGDIAAQVRLAVAEDETASSLYALHMDALARMLAELMPRLADGTAPRVAQDHSQATYCARRTPADGLIDWTRDADRVWALIRASGDPYPGAFTFQGGERLAVWEADRVHDPRYWGLPGQVQAMDEDGVLVQCGDGGHVRLRIVQRGGGERVKANTALRMHEKLGMDWAALYAPARGGAS